MCWTLLVFLSLLSWSTESATIYLCNVYSGGSFWASDHCQNHKALIDRIVTVPDGIPWDQQVALSEQNRTQGVALFPPIPTSVTTQSTWSQTVSSNQAQCASLAATIESFDRAARQPQTGQVQASL